MDRTYKTIVRWGKNLGSFDYYIDDQVQQASEDNAPQNATFKRQDGSWATTYDIKDEILKQVIEGGN